MQKFIEYSPEVLDALNQKKPILALESTIITHGLPEPFNFETAVSLENIARAENVTPATIAIIDGKIKIGLTQTELENLAHNKNNCKASQRDLCYIIGKKLTAGTTVAATLFCSNLAGIKVFATGGIGGVHRGEDLDISADLIELARTPIAVVCAGAKAILDLAKTLEFLETHSVPVIGYQTKTFPAFYSAATCYALSTTVNHIQELAAIANVHWQLGNNSGIIVANPIPLQHEIAAERIEPLIQDALQKALHCNIVGKEITPFLLSELAQLTKGASIKSNLELIKNNVFIGAQLARAIHEGNQNADNDSREKTATTPITHSCTERKIFA